jgi:DNA-binding NarL/FixJ family response regulator
MSNHSVIQLFVVEDSKVVSVVINQTLVHVPDFNIIGFAYNGETAVRRILELKPDIALIDLGLPDLNGIEVIRRVKERLKDLRVIVLTASETVEDIVNSLSAGADGYVLKDAFSERLELAVRSVRLGAVWLDPEIAKRLLWVHQSASRGPQVKREQTHLSQDEVAYLGAVADSSCEDGVCLVQPEFLQRIRATLLEKGQRV